VPRRHAASAASSASNLSYGGAIDGVGVTTGTPRVYLILWGSQWGSQSTNSSGYRAYSGDPMGMAPDLQAFFKGLGTGGEAWSGVMTQYCQGVATGAQSCPSSGTAHVGYPVGGALVGTWEDSSSAAPSQATAHQIAVEAVRAASHFADFSPAAQYFIVSPTGTFPDGFDTPYGQFCAWHDYSGDSTMDGGGAASSPSGPVAFTNMPYVTDAGSSCGENFVNAGSAGTLDGVTIVGGHEYAETITDEFPAGGWTDSSGNENGDKCAWISSGQGASQNVTLTTGQFAIQSTWANDYNGGSGGCEVSHSIVSNGPSVTYPGSRSTTVGTSASLQMKALNANGTSCTTCTFTATGLPSGFSISSSGLIAGTAATTTSKSTVTVTATNSTGSGSTTFTWSIVAGPAARLTVSPASATVPVGASQKLTVTGTDQYGNAGASVSQVSWSPPSGLGTVSPATGASTTFTGGAVGSGTITASLTGATSGTASVTVVANAITNGGFETGLLSPWTSSGAFEAAIQSTACYGPTHCAQLGKSTPTNGSSSISQTFTAPSGTPTLSFYYKVVCLDTVTYDWATATLKDNTAATTTTVLAKTCTNTGSWVKVSKTTTGGHSYTLTLTSHDDNYPGDPTYALYDNVVVH
jgi:serine protease